MKLALGTVQFGMKYGIANAGPKTSFAEVIKILQAASIAGIHTFDTAPAYGDSEQVLAQALKVSSITNARIISKVSKIPAETIDKQVIKEIDVQFSQTSSLFAGGLYGLLLHQTQDCFKPGAQYLFEYLAQLRNSGRLKRIGISVYSPEEMLEALDAFNFDMVQLPINLFDQRFLPYIPKLAKQGIEIYARSAFLQGLLLMPCAKIVEKFPEAAEHVNRYSAYLEQYNLTPLQACLGFVKNIEEISKILIGVTSHEELDQILAAYPSAGSINTSILASDSTVLIDPRRWA